GAIGFLWLLVSDNVDRVRRFGRRFTGDGRDVDLWEPSPLAAAGRRLAAVGVVAAIALPVAVPGMTTGLLDRFGPAGNGSGMGTGPGGNHVNLWALLQGELNRDDEFVMVEVRSADTNPGYLRFGVADVLSPDGFRNRMPSLRSSASNLPDPRRSAPQSVTWVEGRARVKAVSFNMQLLPVYSQPLTTNLDSVWQYDSAMQVIYTNRTTTRGRQYDFTYVRPEYTPEALRTAQPLATNDTIQRQYTTLPSKVPLIEEKVQELTRGLVNPYDKVRALYNHFSSKNGYQYSLETRQDTSGNAMVDFLTNKTGFCVQYAAALAWMVRVADIPARVAFGFTRGSQREGDVSKLTNFNLHAWTEVYFDKFGWVPFDATPGTYIRGALRPPYAPDVYSRDPESSVNPSASPGAAGSGGVNPDEEPGKRPLNEEDQGAGAGGITPADPRWPGYLVIGGALLLFLLASPALRRLALRRRRRPTPARAVRVTGPDAGPDAPDEPRIVVGDGAETARARRDAHAAWDELVDTLVDLRLPVDPVETPRTTTERIIRDTMLSQAVSVDARLLGMAEERARYAREPLGTDRLAPALRAVRRALVERVSWRTRLRAMLLPPSVLQRWRAVSLTRSTQTITMLAQARDSVLRVFSPRRLLPSRR
ncbi:MAG TPA: transglutaminaseTgpA domain-containing protein, partial [Micromonosporaceae bacterium]|nr:transglutaminaseTgpA domain-containing protein [Micromonosporaceae bacterium]